MSRTLACAVSHGGEAISIRSPSSVPPVTRKVPCEDKPNDPFQHGTWFSPDLGLYNPHPYLTQTNVYLPQLDVALTRQPFLLPVLLQLSIPRAVPLVYDLDEYFEPIRSSSHVPVGPLRGHFLGDAEELRAALEREGMQLGPAGGGGVGVAAPEVVVPSSTVGPTEDHPFVL